MKRLFSIGPWLVDLINPPPRDMLSLLQKTWRMLLVTITLCTLCVIAALLLSLGLFVWQRSREVMLGFPQLVNILTILAASVAVNVACILMLLQVKRMDRKLIPPPEGKGPLAEVVSVRKEPPAA